MIAKMGCMEIITKEHLTKCLTHFSHLFSIISLSICNRRGKRVFWMRGHFVLLWWLSPPKIDDNIITPYLPPNIKTDLHQRNENTAMTAAAMRIRTIMTTATAGAVALPLLVLLLPPPPPTPLPSSPLLSLLLPSGTTVRGRMVTVYETLWWTAHVQQSQWWAHWVAVHVLTHYVQIPFHQLGLE